LGDILSRIGKTKLSFLIILVVFVISIIIVFNSSITFQKEDFEQKRVRVLNELSLAIEEAKAQGKYKCCIEPPCTMCYLGNWIWKDGSCYCDDMIKENKLNFVCPECLRGIKEGRCESKIGSCQIINSSEIK
jgi:hypothetical protein